MEKTTSPAKRQRIRVTKRRPMPHVKVRAIPLSRSVETVLREVRIAGAAEEIRRIENRLGPRVRRERRNPACEQLLKTRLQCVVIRVSTRFQQINIVKPRIRSWHEWQSGRQHTRLRLINVSRRQKFCSLRTN